jgi:hypothetical protein
VSFVKKKTEVVTKSESRESFGFTQTTSRPDPPTVLTTTEWRTYGERCYDARMDEGRKRVILIAASILAARKLAMYEGGTRVPATVAAIADSIRWAETILNEIDKRWPGG